MGVYKDPATGRFVEPPAGAPQRAAAAGKTGSTSAGRLIETPGQTPAGGFRLDMQGHSDHDAIATKDAQGRITVHHLPAPSQLQP